MKHIAAFLAGFGAAALIAFGLTRTRAGRRIRYQVGQIAAIDLNTCSLEDLAAAGLSRELAERIVENRPYRSKLELVERYIVPAQLYATVRERVKVSGANEAVKVAS